MTDTVSPARWRARRSWIASPSPAVLWGCFATAIGQAFVFAILPPLGRSVGLDEVRITAIISTSALVFTLVAPFWGRFSDQRWSQARHSHRTNGLLHWFTLPLPCCSSSPGIGDRLTLFVIALDHPLTAGGHHVRHTPGLHRLCG